MLQRIIPPYLLARMSHEHIARLLTVLEHVSGSCIEQRKEDVVGAEEQPLVLK